MKYYRTSFEILLVLIIVLLGWRHYHDLHADKLGQLPDRHHLQVQKDSLAKTNSGFKDSVVIKERLKIVYRDRAVQVRDSIISLAPGEKLLLFARNYGDTVLTAPVLDSANTTYSELSFTKIQFGLSDSIISDQKTIILNDSLQISLGDSIGRVYQKDAADQRKVAKKYKFQRTIAIIAGGAALVLLAVK